MRGVYERGENNINHNLVRQATWHVMPMYYEMGSENDCKITEWCLLNMSDEEASANGVFKFTFSIIRHQKVSIILELRLRTETLP